MSIPDWSPSLPPSQRSPTQRLPSQRPPFTETPLLQRPPFYRDPFSQRPPFHRDSLSQRPPQTETLWRNQVAIQEVNRMTDIRFWKHYLPLRDQIIIWSSPVAHCVDYIRKSCDINTNGKLIPKFTHGFHKSGTLTLTYIFPLTLTLILILTLTLNLTLDLN